MAATIADTYFSQFWSWESKIKALAGSMSAGSLPPGSLPRCLFAISSRGGRGKGSLWDLFHKRSYPLMRDPWSCLIASQRPHLLIPSHGELGFNMCFKGTQTFSLSYLIRISILSWEFYI